MKDLQARLLKAEDSIAKHERDIDELLSRSKNKENQSSNPSSGKNEKDLEELKRELRDKL